MTYKEKLIQDNPTMDEEKLKHRLTWDCPSWHGYEYTDPVFCDNGFTPDNCLKCWDREYIEQTPTIGDIFKCYSEEDGCDEEHDPVEYYGKAKVRKSVDILKDHLKMLDIADERREYMTIAIECLEYMLEEK